MMKAGAGAALMAAGPLLAACGGSSGETTAGSTTGGTSSEVGGELDIFVWQGYDAAVPARKAWEKETGAHVNASFIASYQDVIPKIKSPAGESIDLSFVGVHQIEQFQEIGILTPITEQEVPQIGKLFPNFSGPEYKDEDGNYLAVPFNFGYNGLACNVDVLGTVTNYDLLFEPNMKGRVGVWDDPGQNMQFVAAIHGFDPHELTHEQLEVVNEWLARLRPQVKLFATSVGDYMTALSNGDIDAVTNAWCASPVFIEGDKNFEVVLPDQGEVTGGVGWVDAMFVPPDSGNRATALAWINELIGPDELAVETYEGIAGGAPCENVPPKLGKATRDLFPYDGLETLFEKAPIALGFPVESEEFVTFDEIVEAWEKFKAG